MANWTIEPQPFGPNHAPLLAGLSSIDGVTSVPVAVDPSTGAILTEASTSGGTNVNIAEVGGSAITLGSTSAANSLPVVTPIDNITTGTIVANGGTVVAPVISGYAGWTMAYQGTYSTGASLVMEASFDGGTTYDVVRMLQGSSGILGYVTVIAAGVNGSSYFVADIPSGATHLRVRASAWAAPTGTINITLSQSVERFAAPAIGGQAVTVTGTITTLTTLTTLTNITNWGNIVDNAAFTDGTTRISMGGYIYDEVAGITPTENDGLAARVDIKRAQVFTLEDATNRGQRQAVDTTGRALVNSGLVPTATNLNTFSTRITTSTTTTPTAATCYISSITVVTTTGNAATTLTIQDKSGTPLILIDGLATTSTLVGNPSPLNFQTPIMMVGGIDIITTGVTPASNNVWINYYQ